MGSPRVLALVPAYNPAPAALAVALRSLLDQTSPLDICLIDDGSRTPVAELWPADPRITIIRLPLNGGITRALRAGVEFGLANGYEYLCRLDVGDISYPQRVATQLAHMEVNPEVDLLGAHACVTRPDGSEPHIYGVTGGPQVVRSHMWKRSAFLHSTFFIRAASVRRLGNYDEAFNGAEDNELMQRMARYGIVDCLPDVLVECPENPGGISARRRGLQLRRRLKSQLTHAAPTAPGWYVGVARTLGLLIVPQDVARKLAAMVRKAGPGRPPT